MEFILFLVGMLCLVFIMGIIHRLETEKNLWKMKAENLEKLYKIMLEKIGNLGKEEQEIIEIPSTFVDEKEVSPE